MLCPFVHLRELDLDGSHLTGPLPRWVADCFPHLKELDLSFGRLSGAIPAWVPSMGNHLQQFKVQQNRLSGSVPPGFGSMAALKVLWLHDNALAGPLPADLGAARALLSVDVRNNAALCGAPPPGLHVVPPPDGQWRGFCAKAFTEDNTSCSVLLSPGTRIGKACSA